MGSISLCVTVTSDDRVSVSPTVLLGSSCSHEEFCLKDRSIRVKYINNEQRMTKARFLERSDARRGTNGGW